MAYLFIDDGAPEAREYDSNYIFFDEDDPEDHRRAVREAERRRYQVQQRDDGCRTSSVSPVHHAHSAVPSVRPARLGILSMSVDSR